MKPLSLRSCCLRFLTLTACFVGCSWVAAGEPGFRRFPDTISPDGNYVFAWGWGMEEHPEQLQEWPPKQDTAGDSNANYLVDAIHGKVLAIIPQRDHFLTSEGRWKQFSGLGVAWAEDSESALAIYEDRWSDAAILWVHPKMLSFLDVLGPLDKAYRGLLAKNEKLKEAGEISFSRPALLPDGILVIDARAKPRVNQEREYYYRLKFRLPANGDKTKCKLVTGRKIRPPDDDNDDAVENELNEAYQKLKTKLNATDFEALKKEQFKWLNQRNALEGDRIFFTQLRTSYLRARAEAAESNGGRSSATSRKSR